MSTVRVVSLIFVLVVLANVGLYWPELWTFRVMGRIVLYLVIYVLFLAWWYRRK